MPVDPNEFRRVMGQFATGVTVVTSRHGSEQHGMTVNALTSVSLNPPLVLFCADTRTRTYRVVNDSGIFAISILAQDQRPLADLFASRAEVERFRGIPTRTGKTGAPILEGSLGWVDCRVVKKIEAGDHVIFLGHVEEVGRGEAAPPLLFYRGTYQMLGSSWLWGDRYLGREKIGRFDELVDFFERMQSLDAFHELLRKFVEFAKPQKKSLVLDLGCGPGALARLLGAKASKVIGVDESERMIDRAKNLSKGAKNVKFQAGRAEKIPLADRSVDLVVSSNLLYLLSDPVQGLREMNRVLKPGGKLALLNPSTLMRRPEMATYLKKHGMNGFGAEAFLSWAAAAEAHQPYDEERLSKHLREATFAPLFHKRTLDGLILFSQAKKP